MSIIELASDLVYLIPSPSSVLVRHLNSHSRVAGRSHLAVTVRGLCGLSSRGSDRSDDYVAAGESTVPGEPIRTGRGVGLRL